jgi:4-hydroxy 2-oxovalerate aldolase
MMIKILDCTLRDGGYINDWNFQNYQIIKILNSLEYANIDIIECGYLNNKKSKMQDSTLFPNIQTVDKFIQETDKSQKVVMINHGDYDVQSLPHKNKTHIDGIRLAFHKEQLNNVLEEAKQIVDLGYKLYFQPMVTKNYTDLEFLSMIEKVNGLNPYSFYIVDSFGSMTLDEFHKYSILADSNLARDIALGYHSHNNMQLAFSNTVSMCSMNLKRDIIIDASIYGIGRGAGNLNTELIADFLNKSYDKSYDTLPLLEIIDEFLSSLMKKKSWGFSPAQFLSASYNCHPNYATYLINKNTIHIVDIKKILEKISDNEKSSFNKNLIEQIYINSILEEKTSIKGTFDLDKNKKILLIASGKSVSENKDLITSKVDDENYISIALNHIPDFETDFYFFTNQKRFDEFGSKVDLSKTIITNNIFTDLNSSAVLDFKALAFIDDKLVTNVAVVLLNHLISLGIKEVEIAGLDGYKITFDNYSYEETNAIYDIQELITQNNLLSFSLKTLSKKIDIKFITPTIFLKENKCSEKII